MSSQEKEPAEGRLEPEVSPDRPRKGRDRLELQPVPAIRRVTQIQVLALFAVVVVAVVYLALRYAHESIGRLSEPGMAPAVRPLGPEQIRAIGVDEGAPAEEEEPAAPAVEAAPAPVTWPRGLEADRGRSRAIERRLAAPLGRGSRRAPGGGVGGERVAAAGVDPGTLQRLERMLDGSLGSGSRGGPEGGVEAGGVAGEAVAGERIGGVALRGAAPRPVFTAGTVIPAVLLHRLHSSEPGLVRGQVTRDVWDSAGAEVVLVPRGTLAYGRQARVPRMGDRRVVVAWERLRFPDGRVLELGGEGEPTAAADGALGVPGRVRQRWGQRFGAAALLSLVGAGAQLSQPQRSASLGAAPSAGQVAAGELGLETSRLAHRILDRTVDLPPVIDLPPGSRLSILLTRDLVFDGPVSPGPASAGPSPVID